MISYRERMLKGWETRRLRNWQNPLKGKTVRTLPGRFWEKVQKTDGCWEWIGARFGEKINGKQYGNLRVGNRMVPAHRISYELHYGSIPEGLFVLHRCDNPGCVRPEHLWIGTKADNARDAVRKGRDTATAHPDCFPRGEDRSNAKLTASVVPHIRRLQRLGYSQQHLAEIFGVSRGTISDLFFGRTWRHVP